MLLQDASGHFLSKPFPYTVISYPGPRSCSVHCLVIRRRPPLEVLLECPGVQRGRLKQTMLPQNLRRCSITGFRQLSGGAKIDGSI